MNMRRSGTPRRIGTRCRTLRSGRRPTGGRRSSSRTRDIENYNLIQTIKPNPLIGTGWGHEYREMNRAYNISQIFAQYRYIAHNSILWLLSIGGVVGFALVWMQIVVGVFLSTRSYRFAREAHERKADASRIAVTTRPTAG